MKYKGIIIGLVAALGVAGFGCEGKNLALTVKNIELERRVEVGNAYVSVTISGQYPQSGNPDLLTAVRQWVAALLSHANQGEQPLFATPPELLENGRMMVRRCSNALIRTSEAELGELANQSVAASHEFDIRFAPSYNSEKLLTYVFKEYVYLGGAHGLTLHKGQTFVAETGEMLTNDNAFRADKTTALIALLRDGLWEQYFKKTFPDGSLDDALLIEPAALGLPSGNPEFGAAGVTFTYQQYEIAPYAAGLPACTIPYAELQTILRPEIADLLPQ